MTKLISLFLFAFSLSAQPSLVTVAGPVTNLDGTAFTGRITISGQPMGSGSTSVRSAPITVCSTPVTFSGCRYTMSGSAFSMQLVPNGTASPSGTSYAVEYQPTTGTAVGIPYYEVWVVPAGGPFTIEQVKVGYTPVLNVMVNPVQLNPSGYTTGQFPCVSGGLFLPCSPVALAPVATSGAYADLTGKPSIPSVTGGACTNQVVTAISSSAVPTCATPSTTNVSEGANLYFTAARAQSALAGLYQTPITGAPGAWPSFATVATSGAYADLTGKPSIPTVTGGACTNQVVTAISSFSAVPTCATPSTTNVSEGSSLYFTNARAQSATGFTYNSGTNTITAAAGATLAIGITLPGSAPAGTIGGSFIYSPNGALNVKVWAKGDGVTNDTANIATVVAIACASNHGLYFPPGTYNANIQIPCAMSIVGEPGVSIIAGLNGDALQFDPTNAIGYVRIQDIVLTAQSGSTSGNGLNVLAPSDGTSQISEVSLTRVTGYGFTAGTGILVHSAIGGTWINPQGNTSLNGIWLDGTSAQPVNGLSIINLVADSNTNRGLLMQNASLNSLNDSNLEMNVGTITWEIGTGSSRNRVLGADTEGNTATSGVVAITCGSSCPHNEIMGVKFGELLSTTTNPILNISGLGDYTVVAFNDFRGGAAQKSINITSATLCSLVMNHSLNTSFSTYITDTGTNTQYLDDPITSSNIAQTRIQGLSVNQAGSLDVVLKDGAGNNAFRSLLSTAWLSGITTQFAQIGTGGNTFISGLNGTVPPRLAFAGAQFQITAATAPNTPDPVAGDLSEVINASGSVVYAVNTAGTSRVSGTVISNAAFPTITGCGTTGSPTGGALAGTFTSGATSCTPVLTVLPTSPHGYVCLISDQTLGTGVTLMSLSSTATTATFPTITTTSGDRMAFQCGLSF